MHLAHDFVLKLRTTEVHCPEMCCPISVTKVESISMVRPEGKKDKTVTGGEELLRQPQVH